MLAEYSAMSQTVFLTVHGTFDAVANPHEPRWWEPNSTFWKTILAPSPDGQITGTVKPFIWSGKNSAFEREVAARALVKQIKALRKTCDNIHLIGHSHGGNVIEDALERIAWNGARKPSLSKSRNPSKIRSVTTLGTPFLDRRESTLRKILIVLMLILVVIILLGSILMTVLVAMLASLPIEGAAIGATDPKVLGAFAAVTLIPLVILLPLLLLFIRNWHTLRFRRNARTPANWLSVFHPQDEAIFLLTSTNSAAYEFYQDGVISANVRRKLDAAMIFTAAAALILFALSILANSMDWGSFSVFTQRFEYGNVLLVLGAFALLLNPVFVVARLIVGLFDAPLRGWANGQVRGILRGLAFGEDHHVKLVDVAAVPFVFECSGVAVAGPTAESMSTEAKDSFIRYINASHQCISWQSAKANSDAIGDMLMGLTTVKTIHSAYFHHPEVVGLVADHLRKSEPEPQPAAS